MKKHLILFHFILSTGFGSWSTQAQGQSDHFVLPPGKAIYQPKEFAGQDWYSDTSRYSYRRMSCTDNLAIFWEKGFGTDLAAPPDLEGHPMAVDLENLKYQLERFYLFYRDSLKFVKPGSQSEKYRMLAMIQYSLEGTAYGGDYDQVIGAFWATPNRLQDKRLNAVAHELGHSFQLQSNGCSGRSTPTGSMTKPITGMLLKRIPTKLFCIRRTFTVRLMYSNIGAKGKVYRLSANYSGKERKAKTRL